MTDLYQQLADKHGSITRQEARRRHLQKLYGDNDGTAEGPARPAVSPVREDE